MKATGIVRRIDDLGRVVIPKEIRRTLRIREGDPLEIFTDREGEIILKKYSPIGELTEFAGEYVESLFDTTRHIAVITDRDGVIAVSGSSKKDYLEKRLSPELEKISPRPMSWLAPLMSRMVRESICDVTRNAIRAGKLALMVPVIMLVVGR